LLVTTLDDICWLLNLRGSDIDFNPVFFAYLLFYPKTKSATLYVDEAKVGPVKEYLENINVTLMPYEQIRDDLFSQ
jgi:Xaa-Pro aminopeptidase